MNNRKDLKEIPIAAAHRTIPPLNPYLCCINSRSNLLKKQKFYFLCRDIPKCPISYKLSAKVSISK